MSQIQEEIQSHP